MKQFYINKKINSTNNDANLKNNISDHLTINQ